MEVTDNGMMQFMPTGGEIHFGAIDAVGSEIEKPFNALNAGRRIRPIEGERRLTGHVFVFLVQGGLVEPYHS